MIQRPESPNTLAAKLRIWGGDGEESSEQGDSESGSGGKDGAGNGDSPIEKTAEQKRIEELEAALEGTKKKHADEKKRADDVTADLQKRDREGMEEHERTEAERDDYKAKYEKLLKVVETSVTKDAIRSISDAKDKSGKPKYPWHDVEAVTAFLDKGEIKIDLDTGEVTGLESQLKNIASKRPYLLVAEQNSNNNQGTPSLGGPATGGHPTGGAGRQRETDRQKLGQKYKLPGFMGARS